jgi:methylmalonyl-CoA mutase
VAKVLDRSGAPSELDPESRLATATYDGFSLQPLYTAADAPDTATPAPGSTPFVRGSAPDTAAGWDVRQRHVDADPARSNEAILADLESGATSVWLRVGHAGVPLDQLDAALNGVLLDLAPIVLDAGADTLAAARALLALADKRGVAPAELRGSLGADPIAEQARGGAAADLGGLGELVELVAGTAITPITVDGTVYHDAGGSDSDELATAAAVGVAYVRALVAAGVEDPFAQLEFRYAVGADQFSSIAKLRAARRIWARIAELSGTTAAQRQHAVTSAAMMTRRDPWVNILRTTIACFAAAVGGAESITVAPFDAALGLPDGFSRRIARNTQAIIHDEASTARVADPAGGSWYVESLTDELAEVAWTKFTALERAGGLPAALESGFLASLLAESLQARRANLATRHDSITGVSAFPLITEDPVIRLPLPETTPGLLPAIRYAQDFEALRDRSDAYAAEHGHRPQLALVTLGPLAVHTGRLGFARELFGVAGIDPTVVAIEDLAGTGLGGATVACICSSDKLYAEQAAAAVQSLRAAGVTQILLAGKPRSDLGSSVVDDYVFAGCDALAVLTSTLATLGVGA